MPLSTGQPNTEDYNLGRGAILFALNDPTTGRALGYRHLGNAPAFTVNVTSETKEHLASLQGLKTVDKEVIISQSMGVGLTLDEINLDNLALFLSGTTSTRVQPASATDAILHVGTPTINLWYDIYDDDGNRAYNLTGATVAIKIGTTALTVDTHYTLDRVMGRVFLKSLNSLTGNLTATFSSAPTATLNELNALTQVNVSGSLKFISINAANDYEKEFQFHKVSLKAEGDFGAISDDWSTLQFTGKAEKNTGSDLTVNGRTCTITDYDQA